MAVAAPPSTEPKPFLQKSEGQEFQLVKNWTFGSKRSDATSRNKSDLDQEFFYRYIWEGGKLDKFKTYWSYHRDYPEGDPKSLHVFGENGLVLKGRIPPGGGLRERGIESGMLRGKIPVTPGMYIEMRAKLPGGVGVWPSFWLEQGVQSPDGTISQPNKPLPEIDIFEFFNWDGRPETRILTGNIQVFGKAADYGNPHDIYTTFKDVGWEKHLDVGFDCSRDFHVFALDWVKDKPIWLLDGKPIKQTYYEWHGPAAHVTVVNSIGMNLPGVKQTQMVADESRWDYTIDYIRIWDRKAGAIDTSVMPVAPEKVKPTANTDGPLTIAATGKWQSALISGTTTDVAKLKASPSLKVDITVPPDAEDAGWFMAKLAINGQGIERTESPKWLIDRKPGKGGIKKETLTWDVTDVVSKLPATPSWFKIELVTQGDHPRTIEVSNIRAEGAAGAKTLKLERPAAAAEPKPVAKNNESGPIPYPDQKDEAAWPGKGPIRAFGYMAGEREAIWKQREKNQGAVAFVGDSLIGGWKSLPQAFPGIKVANCGVGGDVSRGVLFRFKEDVLGLKPRAVVVNVGFNDLTAGADPAQAVSNIASMLDQAWEQSPAMPVVVCTIPPRNTPQAAIKPGAREDFNARLAKLAADKEHLIILDMVPAFTDADGKPKPEYFANDRVHLIAAGYEKWAELFRPIFEKLKLK